MKAVAHTAGLERRRLSDRAWQGFVRDGLHPDAVPAAICRSWLRARNDYRIDPGLRRPARSLGGEALRERVETDDLLRLAGPILADFAGRLEIVDQVVTLFDGDGFMLSIDGRPGVIEAVSEIGFRPGACWSENSAGTNGPGTALAEGRPLEVFGSEHYVAAWQPWTCAAAPIHAPSQAAPVGIIDLTGPWQSHPPHAVDTVAALARALEERLRAALSVREEVVRHAFRAAHALGDGLVAVDARAAVIAVNDAAARARLVEAGQLPARVREALRRVFAAPATERGAEITVQAAGADRLVIAPVLHDGVSVGALVRLPARPLRPTRARPSASATDVRGPDTADRPRHGFARILGASPGLRTAVELARIAAANALPVTLFGESGTGKELFARAIHQEGLRAGGPFVAVNCGSIPAELVESELFGYERGTFTGGRAEGKPGRFEDADGGTLFLDEVTELAGPAQTALLRVLQEREVVRVGGSIARPVNVRIIAASNRPLLGEVHARHFRRDLFYRLNVLPIDIPPLRDREGDVALLARALLEEVAAEVGRGPVTLAPAALKVLERHPWPGNVRELRNVLLRAAATAPGLEIAADDLHFDETRLEAAGSLRAETVRPLRGALGEQERAVLVTALEACGWNIVEAAARLGISRMTLYRRLARYGLSRPRA
jgi:transcriptional regulator of acetoin/glycerol metabolism